MNVPLVSIIIPAFNMEQWIADTLHSVMAQTETNWECLVINDGSTDNTAAVVATFTDPRIRLVQKHNGGVSSARNLGLQEAQGEFIVFLDADDLWVPNALAVLISPMQKNTQCTFTWADFLRFHSQSNEILPTVSSRNRNVDNAFHALCIDNFLQFGALAIRASIAKHVAFDETLIICEDRDWLLRVLPNQKAEHLPTVIHHYRQREGSAVRNIERFIFDEQRVINRILALPDVPKRIKKRAQSAYEFHCAVLNWKSKGGFLRGFQHYAKAIFYDPLYFENYMRPAKKIFFACIPKNLLKIHDSSR